MENNYLIPANANRGKLIMGLFTGLDFAIFGTGCGATLLMLLVFQNQLTNIAFAVLAMAPALVTGFLVIPVPHQHNVRVFFTNMNNFFKNNRRYYWRGWCYEHGEDEPKQKTK